MENTYDQQQYGAQRCQSHSGYILRQQDVGDHHQCCHRQLYQSPLTGGDLIQKLVDGHIAGIKHGGKKGQQDTGGLSSLRQTGLGDPGDKHHAAQGGQHAEELSGGQLFVEQKGGGQRHEHRRHVVAQGSGGHGGVTVGFKQCDPVEADDRAGKSQQLPMRLDACPPKGCPAEIQQEQQKYCAHRTADKGNDGGGQVDIADKDADGAEGGDGNDEIQLGTVDGLHRTNLSWKKMIYFMPAAVAGHPSAAGGPPPDRTGTDRRS